VESYDTEKFILGKLCRLGHEHGSTGKGLRTKSGYGCIACIALRKNDPISYQRLHAIAQKNTPHGRIAIKQYYKQHAGEFKIRSRECQTKMRITLGRSYVRSALKGTFDITSAKITPELEQMKREQLLFTRAIRSIEYAYNN